MDRSGGAVELPLEIWEHIISYVSSSDDLYHCLTLCKALHPLALRRLYQSIHLAHQLQRDRFHKWLLTHSNASSRSQDSNGAESSRPLRLIKSVSFGLAPSFSRLTIPSPTCTPTTATPLSSEEASPSDRYNRALGHLNSLSLLQERSNPPSASFGNGSNPTSARDLGCLRPTSGPSSASADAVEVKSSSISNSQSSMIIPSSQGNTSSVVHVPTMARPAATPWEHRFISPLLTAMTDRCLDHLVSLDVSGAQFYDSVLEEVLRKAPHLTRLNVAYSSIKKHGLSAIASCPRLQMINVSGVFRLRRNHPSLLVSIIAGCPHLIQVIAVSCPDIHVTVREECVALNGSMQLLC